MGYKRGIECSSLYSSQKAPARPRETAGQGAAVHAHGARGPAGLQRSPWTRVDPSGPQWSPAIPSDPQRSPAVAVPSGPQQTHQHSMGGSARPPMLCW